MSFSVNKELSKAVSKYSDDDEEEAVEPVEKRGSKCEENIDCKLLSSPRSPFNVGNSVAQEYSHHHSSSLPNSFLPLSDDNSSTASTKKHIPQSDKSSRSRCFDYLVGAIDEAWARYCDAASYVEDETYGYNTPGSVGTDDEEECVGNTTDLTDYESDFDHAAKPAHHTKKMLMMMPQKGSMMASYTNASKASSTAGDPSSCQLQALKDRLIKAKYFLQDLVESDDYNDTIAFWKRWDMIKYATIELVEDDDDDEVIESTIDELEDGRLFSN